MQRANLTHVIASPFGVGPKLLNNQQINLRKISSGLRGEPVLSSLNRGPKSCVRDQRFWPGSLGVGHMALSCVAGLFKSVKSLEGVLGFFFPLFLPGKMGQLQTVLRKLSMTPSLAPKSIIYVYVFVCMRVCIYIHIYACTHIQSIHINQSICIKIGLEGVSGDHPVLPCVPRLDQCGVSGCSQWVLCIACGLMVPHPQTTYLHVPLALAAEGLPRANPQSLTVSP